jgi:four helix bundle protein
MQSDQCKMHIEGPRRMVDLPERLLTFGAAVIGVAALLPYTFVGRHVGGRLIRAGTSAGANYDEACGAESRADFVHKMQVVLKELRESRYWLRLIHRASLLPPAAVEPATQGSDELCRIIGKSVATSKSAR